MDVRSVVKAIAWLIILVVSGRVSFDLHLGVEIPITGQSLAVILSGYFLTYKELTLLYTLYLGGGATGLPFFADGSSGISILIGKSGGYLYSFPIAAGLVQYIKSKNETLKLSIVFISFLLATAIILLVGMLHLSTIIGLGPAWTYGVVPYLAGGLIKCILGLGVIWSCKLLISRTNY